MAIWFEGLRIREATRASLAPWKTLLDFDEKMKSLCMYHNFGFSDCHFCIWDNDWFAVVWWSSWFSSSFQMTFWVSVQSIFYILRNLEILCFKCFLVDFSIWWWPGLLWAWWYTGCTWVFLLKGQLVWIEPLVLPKYSLVVDLTLGIAWVLFFLSAQFCMISAYPCHSRWFFLLISEQKRVQVRSLDSSTLLDFIRCNLPSGSSFEFSKFLLIAVFD